MGQKLQGLLIRKRRQEREWSQAALCNGICAVSYLSKIEQGKVESSPEVLNLLFRRLGIQWQEDPAFCREAAAWFEEYYDRLFSGEDLQDMTQELLRRETAYRNSPFFTVPSFWIGCSCPGRLPGRYRRRWRCLSLLWMPGSRTCICA